ncbi:MAG: hydroxylamine reductase [bacterium]|nr:hydroxylamine reductase [bacterium]
MFCNQCEQTARGIACTTGGVCGKSPDVAALQDLLIHGVKELSALAVAARELGVVDAEVNRFVCEGLFLTVTNVSFDPERLGESVHRAAELTAALKDRLAQAGGKAPPSKSAAFRPAGDLAAMVEQGQALGPPVAYDPGCDTSSLQLTTLYGYKGVAAYAYHASLLGEEDDAVYASMQGALAQLLSEADEQRWLQLLLECGKANLLAMELLDRGHTGRYGHPVPTRVPLGPKQGKCILVSGHDLLDLEAVLQATADKGVDVYTHGEMLPAHGYPRLKAYPHFYGHYGTAWHNQAREFAGFPGAIIMTTNCIQKPRPAYAGNIFTSGPVGWPGIPHLHGDFSPAVQKALAMPGFSAAEDRGSVTVGFGHRTVLARAGQVLEAIRAGRLKHIFLVGGCDGARESRSYYSSLVSRLPGDALVLTLACGKYRFFDQDLGTIGELPRLLDIGQCNDAFSAVRIAGALAEALDCGINDLPLSLVVSWYEQKAVGVLLTLLYLGVRNIHLGPTLPAFVSPGVLRMLADEFNLRPITSPEQDLAAMIGG